MATRQRLRRAGRTQRGRGCFGRRSPTPNQPPPDDEWALAVTDDSPSGPPIEGPAAYFAVSVAGTDDPRSAVVVGAGRAGGGFLVSLQMAGGEDSGARSRCLERLLGAASSTPAATEDPDTGESPGAGVREPLPKPLAPLTGAVSVFDNTKEPALA